jgi:clorobiocin/coumermycin A biosynthesis protein CloN6/CouN6
MDTVAYCENLLRKYQHKVVPLICPMVPFLDPGSTFFEHPDKHGYRIFHRSLEQHRLAMVEPLWYKRLNYETIWMSRREIQNVTYDAIEQLAKTKRDLGLFSSSMAQGMLATINETRDLLTEIERCLQMQDHLSPSLRVSIQAYNRKILAYSSDQIIPLPRPFGGRWFDDFTVSAEIISQSSI